MVLESGEVDENLINMFLEFTGSTDREIARNYIESTNGDMERAAELFLTGMPPEPLVVQRPLMATSVDEVAQNISSELEMLMRSAGGNEGGMSRLQELTTRFLRMSGRGTSTARNSRNKEVFPQDTSLYLKFDSQHRIKDEVKKFKNSKNWGKIYELGNLAIHSKETCETILKNNVVEDILLETLTKGDSKEAERTIIRSLQVFEALSISVFMSFHESRERCGRWFISPRRTAASSSPSMTFLNGLITISAPGNGSSSSRSHFTQQFIDKVLPTSDIDKLEHMWLSDKFDPHWRDKKTESEMLSLSLYRGCSIKFLSRLVGLVRGCRACVNPELDRVGSLEKPIVLAARADFVTNETDISSDVYLDDPDKSYSLPERKEIWSHRACEILLDYGAKVSVVLKNQKDITDSARKLFELELAAKRTSGRLEFLRMMPTVSISTKNHFAKTLVPLFFQRAMFTLRTGAHGIRVKRRILDVLSNIVAMFNKKNEFTVLKQLLYDTGVFKELILLFLEIFDNESSLVELKVLAANLAINILAPQEFILPTLRVTVDKFISISDPQDFQIYLITKLQRFGVYSLMKQSSSVCSNPVVKCLVGGLGLYLTKANKLRNNSRLLKIVTCIEKGEALGLKNLAGMLMEDPFQWSENEEYGITLFEFQESKLCAILSNFMNTANSKQIETFFQFFQPPLNEMKEVDDFEESEVAVAVQNQEINAGDEEEVPADSTESLNDISRISIGLHHVNTSKENALYNLMLLVQQSLGKGLIFSNKSAKQATSVKTLIDVLNLKLNNVLYPRDSFSLQVLPITSMAEVESQVLRSWSPKDPKYINFCYNLVGHRIRLRSKYDSSNQFDDADVLVYDSSLNAHIVNIFHADQTSEKSMLNLLLFDFEIIAKITSKELKVCSEAHKRPMPRIESTPRFSPGDSVYVWFSGKSNFKELCEDSNSNFSTEGDTTKKVFKFYKAGWYSAEIIEVEENNKTYRYTIRYLEPNFKKDKLIRQKCEVKLNPKVLTSKEFAAFTAEDTGRVCFIERGYLVTNTFNNKIMKLSDVERISSPIHNQSAPIYEILVEELRLFTEKEVYKTSCQSCFSVYLELKNNIKETKAHKLFNLHQRIKARWGSRSKYYSGFISRVNLDGTYDISYDDGDTERQVIPELITDFDEKPLPSLTNITSFTKVFPSSARKKLFEVLREKDSVLGMQSKYSFMSRGFKDEADFEACFATSLAEKGHGVFAKYQNYEQATILANRLHQLQSIDLGIGFEIQAIVEYEPNAEVNSSAREEINSLFLKQWNATAGDAKEDLRVKLRQKCQTEVNLDYVSVRDRVQALVEVETEEKGRETLWFPGTVLIKNKGLLTVVLDNGTVVDCLNASQIRTQLDIKTKISFKSSERSKVLSPTRQVASPIGRRRKQKVSDEDWANATQSLMPLRSSLFDGRPEDILSDSNLEVVFSDELVGQDNLSEIDEPIEGLPVKAANKVTTTALTRKFTAFGESMSYKHISTSNTMVETNFKSSTIKIEKYTGNLNIPKVAVYFWIKTNGKFQRYNASEFRDMSVHKFSTLSENIFKFSVELVQGEDNDHEFCSPEETDISEISSELYLLKWLKEKLSLQSMGNASLKGTYETSLPWKNFVVNDIMKTALADSFSVTTLDFPVWPKYLAHNYSFLVHEKVRENLIRYFSLGTSRAVAYLQDKTPGYMPKKKKLVQATLELSTLFTGANPDILKYEQLQSKCEKLDVDIKQMENEHFIGKLNEDLVKVSRQTLLDDAFKVINEHKHSRSRMIVQFIGENSSGDGVTTDFYTSIAVELQKRAVNRAIPIFVDTRINDDAVDINFGTGGLFVQPLAPCGGSNEYEKGKKRNKAILDRYYFLGLLFGKAFLDGHRIPLPLSTEFFEALISFHQDAENFSFDETVIDKIEGSDHHEQADSKSGVVRTLISLYEKKDVKQLESLLSDLSLVFVDISQPFFPKTGHSLDEGISKTIESKEEEPRKPMLPEISLLSTEQSQLDEFATKASKQGCSQEDIEQKLIEVGATKVQVWKALGGSQHIRNKLAMAKAVATVATHIIVGEFVESGSTRNVDIDNVGKYLELIKDWWLRYGVTPQISCFLKGLTAILGKAAIDGLMNSFNGVELKHLFCGTEDIVWDEKEALLGLLVPSGEYNAGSKPILQLVSILKEMSTKERSLFLNFATAQPRVPTSGLPKIKVYPPLMERTLGINLGFAVSALATDAELRALETAVKPFVPGLFQEGDVVQVKTTGSVTSAVVQSWSPAEKKILFKGEPKGWFQTGQLLRMNSEFASVLKKFKAEIAIKKVIELPAVVQCKPYLRPKATTCAKTIYLPDGYRDEEHMLSIFREAFEDARLGGIHD